jgi:predicted TIM-barrel fold metal-dependent hydrolase
VVIFVADFLTRDAAELPLVDHHCHGVMLDALTEEQFLLLATESDWPAPPGTSGFDSPLGVAIRALCAAPLELERHCSGAEYLRRREDLGPLEVARRLLAASGTDTLLIDTGFHSSAVATPQQMAEVADARAFEVVRLEALAEEVAISATAETFGDKFLDALNDRAADAIAVKSIAAYRYGLDLAPEAPSLREVRQAAGEFLRQVGPAGPRITDPVLLNHLVWSAVTLGKPIQVHVGYGDPDIVLHRCDPSLMTAFLHATRSSGTQIMLLHCYPFVREAAILAQLFPHVWLDVGLAVNHTGVSSGAVIAQSMEIAPFHKILYASDAYGLPELYACAAALWRRYTTRVLAGWVEQDLIGIRDARRYLRMIGRDNARRAYGLDMP